MKNINLIPKREFTYEQCMDLIMNHICVLLLLSFISIFIHAAPDMSNLRQNIKTVLFDLNKISK